MMSTPPASCLRPRTPDHSTRRVHLTTSNVVSLCAGHLYYWCRWGRSSVKRAPHSHCGGRGFDSHRLHHFYGHFRGFCLRLVLPCKPCVSQVATKCGFDLRQRLGLVQLATFLERVHIAGSAMKAS